MYTIITRDQCNFCDVAKALLEGAGQSYQEYNVQDPKSKWVLTLIKQANYRTVPQIFSSDGTYVGGCQELQHLITSISEEI